MLGGFGEDDVDLTVMGGLGLLTIRVGEELGDEAADEAVAIDVAEDDFTEVDDVLVGGAVAEF